MLKEIRNLNLLKDKHDELRKRIKELQQLEESIGEKIKHLQYIYQVSDFHV